MRLLRLEDNGGLSLTEFVGEDVPCYAVLSHTWGRNVDEVTLRDITDGTYKSKDGYGKIQSCGQQAAKDGLEYFWVDTCCIDKSSSAELTESINSMFSWYSKAVVCYVFLVDLKPLAFAETGISHCHWFTRGWTLQELLAPKVVNFYDTEWNFIGTKLELANVVSDSTRIPVHLLLEQTTLSDTSIAMKMYQSLPASEEEIIKRNNDLTIFAWDVTEASEQQFIGLFAPSPAAFSGSSGIMPFTDDFANFSVTNKGLFLTGDIPLRVANVANVANVAIGSGIEKAIYFICLGLNYDPSVLDEDLSRYDGGIYLRKIGPRFFCREGLLGLAGFREYVEQIGIYEVKESYILLDLNINVDDACSSFRNLAIYVPIHEQFQLEDAIPESLWDHTDQVFLRPNLYSWAQYPTVLVMKFSVFFSDNFISVVVLCDYRGQVPKLKICIPTEYKQEMAIIFQKRHREESISWEELEIQAPRVRELSRFAAVKVGDRIHQISVKLERGKVGHISDVIEVYTLNFVIDGAGSSSVV